MTYIRPGLPPTFIVYGDVDRTVDPTQDLQIKKALDEAGVLNGIHPIVGPWARRLYASGKRHSQAAVS